MQRNTKKCNLKNPLNCSDIPLQTFENHSAWEFKSTPGIEALKFLAETFYVNTKDF